MATTLADLLADPVNDERVLLFDSYRVDEMLFIRFEGRAGVDGSLDLCYLG